MLATNTTPGTENQKRVMVGDDHVVDALSHLQHEARLLTLAILGYVTTLDDVRGESAPIDPDHPFKRDPNDDWGHDIENLAGRMTSRLENIIAAVEAADLP